MPWGAAEANERLRLRWQVERNDGGAQPVETGSRELTMGLEARLLRGVRQNLDVAAATVDVRSGTARVVVALLAAAGRPRQPVQRTGVQNRRGAGGNGKKHRQQHVEMDAAHDSSLPRRPDLGPRPNSRSSAMFF